LDAAYAAFFKACKDRAKGIANDTREPQLKRRDHHGSYTTFQKSVKALWSDNKVILPKLGEVNAVLHRKFSGKINNVTVSYNKSNQYFVSFNIEESTQILPKKKVEYDSTIGIDLGVKNSIITSEGVKYDTLRVGSREDRRERMLHRRYSKKKKGSKNAEKARLKLAKYRNKLVNRKNAFIDKVSSDIVCNKTTNVICVENLNVQGMVRNHRLAKSIQESSFNDIKTKLQYKSAWNGIKFVEIDRFFPSSKTCSHCGYIKEDLKLSERSWICPHCGEHIDRDINAAINIKKEGYRILTEAQQ
jgi:putative transposase